MTAPMSPLEAANQRIRDAAKWLIASSAAVGAALIAGSQLSSLGRLDAGPRLWIAGVGALLGVTAVAIAIASAVGVLLPVLILVSDLATGWEKPTPALAPVVAFFRRQPKFLQGAKTPAEIIGKREEQIRLLTADPPPSRREAERIRTRIANFDLRIDAIEAMANHEALKAKFRRSLRRLLVAAVLATAGIVAFAWAANPPARPITADLRGANLTNAMLRDADLRGAKLDGADLTGSDLLGANLEGASVAGVTWRNTTCPDGSNSDADKATCAGHLSRG